MLDELRIRNFAIIDNLELQFGHGFNVITGETGAGKSIIVDAVELILGGKPDAGQVRTGAEKSVIEADLALVGVARTLILPILKYHDLLNDDAGDEFVTLSREVRKNGRSTARINGVAVNQDVLREVGDTLVDIHGQSEHMSLFDAKQHIDLLDRFADLLEIREALATVVTNLGDVRKEITRLMSDEAELKRHADQLRRDVEEIDAAEVRMGEDDELQSERKRLANSEQLAEFSAQVMQSLSGDESSDAQASAVDQLMRVSILMSKLAAIDDDLRERAELAEGLSDQAQELAIEMSGYGEKVEYDPQRINEIEERLELINGLRRRFGLTVDLVLEHAEKARQELDNIEHSSERLVELQEKEIMMLRQIGELGANISNVRQRIGQQLSKRVVQELQDLRMERTQFECAISYIEDPNGCYVGDKRLAFSEKGIDNIEFMLSANPGEPVRPLAKIASGGEAARIMLALKRVLTEADHTPSLIFDEVDQGIGGRVGNVVGQKLWELSDNHQVLVVTHMPQLAGYADKHFHVRKEMTGGRTITQVIELSQESQRIDELSAMLGATGEGSVRSAQEILNDARAHKTKKPVKG
jgi:DNA repair protein RecN (Recombination protein N)